MKFIVKTSKPRNPLVALARLRKAGSHRSGAGAQRRQTEQALRRELDHLVKPGP